MKLIDLFERKLASDEYAYHGTKGDYLSSILKNGLIPNKKSAGYGSDEKASGIGYKLNPLSGVYLASDAKNAASIAQDVGYKSQYPSVVIVMRVQKRTADLDEDQITKNLIKNITVASTYSENPQTAVNVLLQNTLEKIKDLNPNQKFLDYITPYVRNYIQTLIAFHANKRKNPEHEDSSEFKTAQNVLTKKLKNNLILDNRNSTFKIDAPIGFSGANRIVGVYSPDTMIGWGDIGAFAKDAYHMVKNPLDIIKNSNRA